MLKLPSKYLYLFENVYKKCFNIQLDGLRIFLLVNIEVLISLALKCIMDFLFVGAMRCSDFLLFCMNALDSDPNVPYGFSICWIFFLSYCCCINSSLLGLTTVYNNIRISFAGLCNGKY